MTKFSDLNDCLEKINRAEAESMKRNEELLREISSVIKQADSHNRKTEQLLKIRSDYIKHIQRLYPEWSNNLIKKNEVYGNISRKTKKQESAQKSNPSFLINSYSKPKLCTTEKETESLYPEFVHKKMHEWKHDSSFSTSVHNNQLYKRLKAETSLTHDEAVKVVHFLEDSVQKDQISTADSRSYLTYQQPPSFNWSQMKVGKSEKDFNTQFLNEPYYNAPINHTDDERKRIFSESLNSTIFQSKTNMPLVENEIRILPQLVGIAPDGRLVLLPMSSAPLNSTFSNNHESESLGNSKITFCDDMHYDKIKFDSNIQVEQKSLKLNKNGVKDNMNLKVPLVDSAIQTYDNFFSLNATEPRSTILQTMQPESIETSLPFMNNNFNQSVEKFNSTQETEILKEHINHNFSINSLDEFKYKLENMGNTIHKHSSSSLKLENVAEQLSSMNQSNCITTPKEPIISINTNQYPLGNHTENHSDLSLNITKKSPTLSEFDNQMLKSTNILNETIKSTENLSQSSALSVDSSHSVMLAENFIQPALSTDNLNKPIISESKNQLEILKRNTNDVLSATNLNILETHDKEGSSSSNYIGSQHERAFEESVLINLLELLIEKVENTNEQFVLSLEEDFSSVHVILGALDIEENMTSYSILQLSMALRYYLKMFVLQRKETPFVMGSVDREINFEGDLRDCIDELFIGVWDLLFIFMVTIITNFQIQYEHVAKVFAYLLLPTEHEAEKLKDVLVVILSGSMEKFSDSNNEDSSVQESLSKETINKSSLPDAVRKDNLPDVEKDISVTELHSFESNIIQPSPVKTNASFEEFGNNIKLSKVSSTFKQDSDSSITESLELKNFKHNAVKGEEAVEKSIKIKDLNSSLMDRESDVDLQHGLSLSESDNESSSISFDSDGMPVNKPPTTLRESNRSKAPISNESSSPLQSAQKERIPHTENPLDISSSVCEKFREQTLMSSSHTDSDDDIDMLMNESLNLSKRLSNSQSQQSLKSEKQKPKQNTISDMKGRDESPLPSANSAKLALKKPGFWDESESDSDVATAPILSLKQKNDDDDFDFDFYE